MRVGNQQLLDAVLAPEMAEWTDARLLGSFIDRHDDNAFGALVRRHGAMVLGVCRRMLRNQHDAEDAFQATFLVLVRRATSIVPREMVGNWLYGVAYQTAVKARAMADRRRAKERQVSETPEPAVVESDNALWQELRSLIDHELSRLPAKYRAPLVLCDMTGFTRKEVAEQLGWPEGTVSGRLSRARAMLADRLTRRGVVLSGGVLGVILSQNAVSASVRTALVLPTIEVASLVAAGQTATVAVAPEVTVLAEGVLRAMMFTKIKIATAAVLAVGLVVSGVGFALAFVGGDGQDGQKKVAPINNANGQKNNGQPAAKQLMPKFFGFKFPGTTENGNNEPNGDNNQNGNNEANEQNNQNGNNEKNGNKNQNGNGQNKNGNKNQNGNGNGQNKNGQPAKPGLKIFGFKLPGNNASGNNEANGQNNQNGNNEKNGNNNQNGNGQNKNGYGQKNQ